MKLKNYLRRAISIPPNKLASKVMDRTGRKIKFLRQRQNDFKSSTYTQPIPSSSGELHRYLQALPINLLYSQVEKVSVLSELFLAHHFNLLGSGWVQVKHGMSCNGLEGYRYEMGTSVRVDSEGRWLKSRIAQSNLSESQRIWSLVDHDYIPIDWHLDFKSGYRWSEDIWYLSIPHGHKSGVDIKVPWELARMQHLPLLAWAYALSKDGQEGFAPPSFYSKEFRNQVLDFIAINPPRFGVNWRSPMDVGIRVANWLVTYDLFRAFGVEFDDEFKDEFFRSIYGHGQHVVKNLEWNEELRGNHYLANIVSLLFVASYLPRSSETDVWLAMAIQELVNEVELQFNSDGANFEGSTNYHRLSVEMVIYATALVLGLSKEKREVLQQYNARLHKGPPRLKPAPIPLFPLPGENIHMPFPDWYIERLEKMAEFTMDITKPNGHVIQIGDNDSGRFLKLTPVFHQLTGTDFKANYANLNEGADLLDNAEYLDEDHLDHRHLVAAISGLFEREDFKRFTGEGWFEPDLIRSLAKGLSLPSRRHHEQINNNHRIYTEDYRDQNQLHGKLDPTRQPRRKEGRPEEKGMGHCKGFRFYVYPDFGLYIYRSEYLYLAIRCGAIGQNGNGGHAHNDNLSFELNLNGRDFIVDGGSYLYTPVPEMRNAFRSTRCHNTVSSEGCEQNGWLEGLEGLFSMKDEAKAYLLDLSTECLEGEHSGFGKRHRRRFNREGHSLIIEDWIDGDGPFELNFNLAPEADVVHIDKIGIEEFCLQIWIDDLRPQIILKGFDQVGTLEGFFSKGYGERVKNQLIRCYRSRNVTQVRIDFGLVSH